MINTDDISQLNMRVLKEFGYHDDHAVGEVIHVQLQHVTELLQLGLAEIVVNNVGRNTVHDIPYEKLIKMFDEPFEEEAEAVDIPTPF